MAVPAVHIAREPLLHILLSAVEIYNRECYGVLFGHPPSRRRNYYRIQGALVRQGVVRRTNAEVETGDRSDRRMFGFLSRLNGLYPRLIGDFHSHPSFRGLKRHTRPSDGDIRDMKSKDGKRRPLGVIVGIAPRGKRGAPWRRLDQRTRLRGTLAGFTFDIRVFRIQESEGGSEPHALVLEVSAGTRKALNRARARTS